MKSLYLLHTIRRREQILGKPSPSGDECRGSWTSTGGDGNLNLWNNLL